MVITFIFSLLFLVLLGNLLWVHLNSVVPYYDTAGHTNLAHIYANIFSGELVANVSSYLKVSTYYPPLAYLAGGLVTSITGYYYKNLQYFSVLVLGLTLLALWSYTNQLTKNKLLSWFAVLFFAFMPHVWEQARYFMLDLPLTCLLLTSLYFLERSLGFSRPKSTAFFFLFAGLAQLTKWYAGLYLIIPFTITLFSYLKAEKRLSPIRLLVFSFVTFALISPWYLTNFKDIVDSASIFSQPDQGDPVSIFSTKNLLYYLTRIASYQIVSLNFIWLLISSYLLLKFNSPRKRFLIAQIALPYLIFTYIGNKNLRYIMPLLPFISIVMGYGMYKLGKINKNKAIFAFLLLCVFNLFLYTVNSFGFPFKANVLITTEVTKYIDNIYLLDLSSRDVQYIYQKPGWTQEVIAQDLVDLAKKQKRKLKILVVSNSPELSVASLQLFTLDTNNSLHLAEAPLDVKSKIDTPEEVEDLLSGFDLAIVPNLNVGPQGQVNWSNMEYLRVLIFSGNTRNWAQVRIYNSPNQKFYLFTKNPEYNKLQIILKENQLEVRRNTAPTKVFFQFMDKDNNWTQQTLDESETLYSNGLENITRFRIDYPPELIETLSPEGWIYDGEKQFDRL